MDLIFNELCTYGYLSECKDESEARVCINKFVEFIHCLKTKNLLDNICFTQNLKEKNISENYGFKDWISDTAIERKYRDFFRTTWDELSTYVELDDPSQEFIMYYNEKKYSAEGLLYAHHSENHVLSLLSNPFFDTKTLNGCLLFLNEDLEIIEEAHPINHLHHNCALEDIKKIKQGKLVSMITSGQDLWEKREALFPNLIFCNNVKDQLYETPQMTHIRPVMEKLQQLQDYFEVCDSNYDRSRIVCNPHSESSTVKANDDLKALRKFKKPDETSDYFFEHISFTGQYPAGRIHILPDNPNKKCYIGYIGRHLPTKKY